MTFIYIITNLTLFSSDSKSLLDYLCIFCYYKLTLIHQGVVKVSTGNLKMEKQVAGMR